MIISWIVLIAACSVSSVCATCPYALIPDPFSLIAGTFSVDDLKYYVHFSLYTNKSDVGQKVCETKESLEAAGFDPTFPVRFIVHGFLNYEFSAVNTLIRNAYLERGKYNVIVVDWSQIAAVPLYMSVSSQVYQIGDVVGMMAVFLNTQFNVSFDNMYIIGHSLGAQVAGAAGRYVIATANAKLNTIFALDPAGPNFEHRSAPEEILSRNDATYVESIQTGKFFGYNKVIGHASFYPNYGDDQPGCTVLLLPDEICSHCRAFEYFAESINSEVGFWGKKCSSYEEIERGACTYPTRIVERMGGEPSNHNREGVFYVHTSDSTPFAVHTPNAEDVRSLMNVRLYTSGNKNGVRIEPANVESVVAAGFNTSLPTRFLVCEYSTTYPATSCLKVVKAYLQKGTYNIIEFDWTKLQPEYKTQIFDDDLSGPIVDFTRTIGTYFNLGANQITVVALGGAAEIVSYAAKRLAPEKFQTLFVVGRGEKADLESATYVQAIEADTTFATNLANSTVYAIPKTLCGFNCRPQLALDTFTKAVVSPGGLIGSTCVMVTFFQTCMGRGPVLTVLNDPVDRAIKGRFYYQA